ncbi:hypothetical protein [Mycolicibacterium sp. HK-90]|uniref:hypothetical protein n=1 Tax=Mycolicibacterium sp. HK-90 TaxID=3056937 RepID=UPI002657ACE2|nr:hypothetical protein [Mycolicibacterium sp. HK-90]WKG04391.1 hypothetical protein QU592_04550 [Mycolicibacterium sp. HK-90]
MAILGLMALACAVWAILALLRGHYATALVAFGATIFWLAPLLLWCIMPSVVAWGQSDPQGTTVRVDKRADALLSICVLAGFLALGSVGVLGAMNKLDLPLPPDIGPMFAMAFLGPAAVFLVAVWLTARRGGIGYIRLTPDGFKFVEAFSTSAGEWAQVIDVTDKAPADFSARSPLVMVMADGEARIIKESALYSRDGEAIVQFVRFYWHHPENRAELTDGRALERLRAVQLGDRTDAT